MTNLQRIGRPLEGNQCVNDVIRRLGTLESDICEMLPGQAEGLMVLALAEMDATTKQIAERLPPVLRIPSTVLLHPFSV
jgi:hypothetical protein